MDKLKAAGLSEPDLDEMLARLNCDLLITRVIEPSPPVTPPENKTSSSLSSTNSSASSLSSFSLLSTDEAGIQNEFQQPENQLEIRQQLWTFTIVKC